MADLQCSRGQIKRVKLSSRFFFLMRLDSQRISLFLSNRPHPKELYTVDNGIEQSLSTQSEISNTLCEFDVTKAGRGAGRKDGSVPEPTTAFVVAPACLQPLTWPLKVDT